MKVTACLIFEKGLWIAREIYVKSSRKWNWPVSAGNQTTLQLTDVYTRAVFMDENFESLKVMVIDDSKTIRRTAETLLKKVGCNVITAVDGFDALAKIADNHPDIIFVDIMMPRLDGYQTCALIKNNSAFRSTPVIMLSSKDGLFDKAKGRIVGSDQYLTKPFSKEELLGAIRAHVPQSETKVAGSAGA
ncbi:Response regulator receiver domain-containing protein [Halopseudomonas bauzanensis]|jgi:twitching motility two-component system response regulator PilG|uniref:Response regulator receiver domain-containing protein n=2 Tax=Halopseudomonas bauzanensis TaxID=653930 RepID=A0A1H9T3B2_9GAMM|nr:Response regulator receiver domain-containing protein [Halopseudomonas bauzanensis]SFL90323.1 Response regulator receiver domain-containing protein [Halopseudomonas bauzanensis]